MMPNVLENPQNEIGADEAGRGPLAGPVVCAAVLLPEGFDIAGLNDSKKLTPARREALFERIVAGAACHIEFVECDEIDRLNILHASLAGLSRSIVALKGTMAAVDGNMIPKGIPHPCRAVVKGDGKVAAIAAASILAKVSRDRFMVQADSKYPGYGFAAHFGYPTPVHLAALKELGPCPIHRRSFAPVRAILEQPCLLDLS
ncbi:ribonuclease HII [bacterium]|nr:MAG: ribonuclease HII [bacterium]